MKRGLIILALSLACGAAAQPAERELLTPVAAPAGVETPVEPSVVRERTVQVHPEVLAAGGDVAAQLFDDVRVTVRLQQVGRGAWAGRILDREHGRAAFVAERGVVAGSVAWPGANYQVRYLAPGVHVVQEIDTRALPEGPDDVVEAPESERLEPVEGGPEGDDPPPALTPIDVLVLYTSQARQRAGGAAALEAAIRANFIEINQAYANSRVWQLVRPVHVTETSQAQQRYLGDNLEALQASAEAAALRDAHGADLVALIVDTAGASELCGVAYMPGVHSVTERVCLPGLTLAHELGHSMGVHHARGDSSSGSRPVCSYGYGYKWYGDPARAFRTVMAYDCPGGCARIPNFSNPDVSHNGVPTGIPAPGPDSADNARCLNEHRVGVANRRASRYPRVSFEAAGTTVAEAAGEARIRVKLITAGRLPSDRTLTVTYATQDGSATAGADYVAISGRLTFAAGSPDEATRELTVPLLPDVLDEDDETVVLRLDQATGGELGGVPTSQLVIADDDPTPVAFTSDVVVNPEGAPGGQTAAVFSVSLSAESGRDVRVGLVTADLTATEGRDYLAVSLVNPPVIIPAGTQSVAVGVPVLGDNLDEDDELFTVRLQDPVNATVADSGEWRGTIVDDEPTPDLTTQDLTASEGDSGSRALGFRVSLSGPSSRTVGFRFRTEDLTAEAGVDYVGRDEVLAIPPEALFLDVPVWVIGDRLHEPGGPETFWVKLEEPVNAVVGQPPRPGGWQGTIVDDEPTPDLTTQDLTTEEGSAGPQEIRFRVSLSGPSSRTVGFRFRTEDVTAEAGVDYVGRDEVLAIPPEALFLDVPVWVIGDRLHEPGGPETFWVKLEEPVNAVVGQPPRPGGWQGTIIDDDPQPTLSVADCTRLEGNSGTVPCAFTVSLSNPSTQPIGVSYATREQSARAGADFQPSEGTLSFAPGTESRTVEVSLIGDGLAEEFNESLLFDLSNPTHATIAGGEAAGTIIDDEAMKFHPIAPCRVLDTRGSGPSGGPALSCDGTKRRFSIGGTCGRVPITAKAAAVNVTTTQQSQAGDLKLYPAGLPTPGTSALNFVANVARANGAAVLLGTWGQATVQCNMASAGGSTHVIVDVFGYYR